MNIEPIKNVGPYDGVSLCGVAFGLIAPEIKDPPMKERIIVISYPNISTSPSERARADFVYVPAVSGVRKNHMVANFDEVTAAE